MTVLWTATDVIFAFRGTQSIDQWVTNIEVDLVALRTPGTIEATDDVGIGMGHRGFVQQMEALWSEFAGNFEISSLSNRRMWFTGEHVRVVHR
jgi:hypothetical protein